MNAQYGMAMTTCPDPEIGKKLADGLLGNRLAACVQALPIHSAYRWKGAIQREPEILLLIKTKAALYPEVEAYLRAHHPYETPEILWLPIAAGFAGYLAWIDAETK